MQTSTLVLVGGAVVAGALAMAIYLRPIDGGEPVAVPAPDLAAPIAEPQAIEPVATAPDETSVAPDPDPETEQALLPEVMQEEADAAQDTAVAEADQPAGPSEPVLTDLRFEPDGGLVLSGAAAPGTRLAIVLEGAIIDTTDALPDGTFLYVGLLGYSDAPRTLGVLADPDGAAVPGDRSFVLSANPAPVAVALAEPEVQQPEEITGVEPDPPVAVAPAAEAAPSTEEAVAELAEDTTEQQAPEATQTTPTAQQAQEATQAAPTEVAEPAQPAILAVTDEGVELVQAPVAADSPPEVMSTVALDTITYDAGGDVVLQGRALGEGFVQVYVDNAPVSRLPVDETGAWRGDLPDVDKGVYTLRIDEVTAEGEVVSRIETPFLREDPATVAEALSAEVADPSFTVATRTVQPGATLWAIAEERYGSGILYVTVFEANRDRIRNPDLIYPGQVFVLPEDAN